MCLKLRFLPTRACASIVGAAVVLVLAGCEAGDSPAQTVRADSVIKPPSAELSATACAERDESCKYLSDMLAKSADFKEALLARLAADQIKAPQWLFQGTQAPLEWPKLDGRAQVFGNVCEPHNCMHAFFILYEPQARTVKGLYVVDGKLVWFGSPSDGEKAWLCQQSAVCVDSGASGASS